MINEDFFWDEYTIRKTEIEKIIRDNWIIMDSNSCSINFDGTINVDGNIKFAENMGFLKELPLRFNKVSGDFDCSKLNLISLKGSPMEVGGTFNCSYNQLSTLEHLPKKAGCFIFDNTVRSFYTGGLNCVFEKVVLLHITDISDLNPSLTLENYQLRVFFKYQCYFEVYNEKIFKNEAFQELVKEMNEGLE